MAVKGHVDGNSLAITEEAVTVVINEHAKTAKNEHSLVAFKEQHQRILPPLQGENEEGLELGRIAIVVVEGDPT